MAISPSPVATQCIVGDATTGLVGCRCAAIGGVIELADLPTFPTVYVAD